MFSVVLIFLLAGLARHDSAGPSPSRFTHYVGAEKCAFEFDIPSDWEVTTTKARDYVDERCAVEVRPVDLPERLKKYDVDVYSVRISLPNRGTFRDAAENNGFEFERGEWITVGRQGMRGEARAVNDGRWSGVQGVITAGCFHEHGGYAGLCELPCAVLKEAHGNVWTLEGGPQSHVAFDMILKTFRFHRK